MGHWFLLPVTMEDANAFCKRSGCNQPNTEDKILTRTLADISKVVDVRILDHLIVGDEVTAFSDLGLLKEK